MSEENQTVIELNETNEVESNSLLESKQNERITRYGSIFLTFLPIAYLIALFIVMVVVEHDKVYNALNNFIEFMLLLFVYSRMCVDGSIIMRKMSTVLFTHILTTVLSTILLIVSYFAGWDIPTFWLIARWIICPVEWVQFVAILWAKNNNINMSVCNLFPN